MASEADAEYLLLCEMDARTYCLVVQQDLSAQGLDD